MSYVVKIKSLTGWEYKYSEPFATEIDSAVKITDYTYREVIDSMHDRRSLKGWYFKEVRK